MPTDKSISDLIKEYFRKHPKQDLPHGPVVDWVEAKYVKLYGKKPRDIWRGIRKLHQEGWLIKVRKGIYRYDPDQVKKVKLFDFTQKQKEEIFKRDDYECVRCGRGIKDGVEIHADHIRSKDSGGKAEIENGQTLCAQHNFQKKNYKQTATGKKMFILLYELAKKYKDTTLQEFCADVLTTYEEHNINCHIEWKK